MPLFGLLTDDAFLLFSRGHKHLYARVVVDLYRRFFSDTLGFPSRHDIVRALYDILRAHPDLWHDGEEPAEIAAAPDPSPRGRRLRRQPADREGGPAQDDMLDRAWRVYNRLLDTGWLEEDSFGLRVTVDMPPAVLLLVDRLAAIESGLSTSFRGVVSIIRGSLSRAVQDLESASADHQAPGAAAGVHKAADMAVGFARDLRMVLATLRGIERDILTSETLKARMGMFFQDFIGRLVLKDFESIYKTNHPYRYKDEILGLLDRLREDDGLRAPMLAGYVGADLATTPGEAADRLDDDLQTLWQVFDHIDQTFDRINAFRLRLETRLRNTLRYADLGNRRHGQRIGALVARLDAGLAAASTLGLDPPEAPMPLGPAQGPLGPRSLREPITPAPPVVADGLRPRRPDPAASAYRALIRAHADLFLMPPDQVMAYLARHMPPGGPIEARDLPLTSIVDVLAFDQLRRYRHAPPPAFARAFAIRPCPRGLWRDDDWLRCPNFVLHRIAPGDPSPPDPSPAAAPAADSLADRPSFERPA